MGVDYKNLEMLKNTSMGTKDEEAKQVKDKIVGKMQNYDPNRKTALIYQYWGKVVLQDSIDVDAGLTTARYKEGLVEIANRQFIIRKGDNPYATPQNPSGFRPFIAASDYLDPDEFWGIGDIEPVKDLQYEANEIENQTIDNIKLITNRMWKIGTNAGVDLGTLISYPGNVVQATDINQVDPIKVQDIPVSSREQRERLQGLIQNISGVSDFSRGATAPGATDTVGGITALIEEANQRFAYKIRILQMTAIKDFAEKLFFLDQIFIKGADLPVRLENDKGLRWVQVRPDNLKGLYDFKPISISMLGNKLSKQRTRLDLLNTLATAPPIPSLVEEILREFDISNIDQVMQELFRIWGIPLDSGVAGLQSKSIPSAQLPQSVPTGDAQLQANAGRQIARENR